MTLFATAAASALAGSEKHESKIYCIIQKMSYRISQDSRAIPTFSEIQNKHFCIMMTL